MIEQDSMWAFADQGSYKMILRKTLKNWPKIKDRAEALSSIINDKFNEQTLFKGFVDSVLGFDSSLIDLETEEVVMEFE